VSSNQAIRILVAEDDRAVRESLVRALQLEGYTVAAANNGAEALEAVRQSQPDVILLDVSMPLVDGLTVCRVLRSEGNRVPVLMLTARTETSDRVAGLDAGADDYLAKPYDLDELLARLRALLRRSGYQSRRGPRHRRRAGARRSPPRPVGPPGIRGEREIQLSKTEFDLLALLVANKGIVLDHSTIYDRIWHYDFGPDSKNLAVYIGYLRRKTRPRVSPGSSTRCEAWATRPASTTDGTALEDRVVAGDRGADRHVGGGIDQLPHDQQPPRRRGRPLDRPGVPADGRRCPRQPRPPPEPRAARGVLGAGACGADGSILATSFPDDVPDHARRLRTRRPTARPTSATR
jgi:two-component system, OmpR family, response regulator MprA